jgi:hypothetical protein
VRLDRIERLREKLLAEILERRVGESEAANAHTEATRVRCELSALAVLAEDIRVPVPRPAAAKLVAPIRNVVMGVMALDLPVIASYPLSLIAGALEGDDIIDVPLEFFAELARVAKDLVATIDKRVPDLVRGVEAERERQLELLVIADDPQLRQLDKVKARLLKEVDVIVRTLTSLRGLQTLDRPDESPIPTVIEFKVLGAGQAR